MSFFTSKREKQYWYLALIFQLTIYATITVVTPVSNFLEETRLLTPLFIGGMILLGLAILFHGWSSGYKKSTFGVILGILAVYIMVLVRIEIPMERTHIFEYGIVALGVY